MFLVLSRKIAVSIGNLEFFNSNTNKLQQLIFCLLIILHFLGLIDKTRVQCNGKKLEYIEKQNELQ